MRMKIFGVSFLYLWSLISGVLADPPPVVAIQPLGPVKQADVQRVQAGIEALYAVSVEVLPEKPLPKSAYYPPRDRYKADGIIEVLAAEAAPRISKVIGFTARDISTTNDEGKDWGIFGLGQLGGRACVISTFRLRAGKADAKLFQARLVKVVNHELGHTFGLDHCPTAGCFMQDAVGKIATVDGESGKPCAECAARLPLVK
ncbi:MAG: archaemetzincin [Luteolibacter sp.]|uniref:archaemetzincin n=1 Tax=Luteolibacter sp. TaxID=1962973 RepID=UPI003266C016